MHSLCCYTCGVGETLSDSRVKPFLVLLTQQNAVIALDKQRFADNKIAESP